MKRRVWFHRARAVAWALAGVAAFAFGWESSVAFVVVASVYANVVSDWGAAEAADDRDLVDRLDAIDAQLRRLNGAAGSSGRRTPAG